MVVLPSPATPGHSSPRPLAHSQSRRMVLPAVTRRDLRARKREPGEFRDPTESIQSPNPHESLVSPQPGLSRDFVEEEGKREPKDLRDHIRTKREVELNASTMEMAIEILYYKLLFIDIPTKLSPGDPIAR